MSDAELGAATGLLKQDGFMGGEVPTNQEAIDRACVEEAWLDLALAGIAGLVSLAIAGYSALLMLKRFGRRDDAGESPST
jgi:hypothetical protein